MDAHFEHEGKESMPRRINALNWCLLGITLAFVAFSGPVHAAFPEKPITIIIPFGPGGGFDRLARQIGARMKKDLGVPVVVKSIPGSGGRRGSLALLKSKPDGYTLGFAHFIPFQSDEFLMGKKTSLDYRKFAVVYQITHSKHHVYVSKKTPYKSLDDLKKAGKPIKFSGTGLGAITWVEASAVGSEAGFPVSFVLGYNNLPRAALAVARGDADAGVGGFVHFQGVLADVRPLVFLGDKRDPKLPDVPSITELGYPQLTVLGSPRVVSAPPGTPEDRLEVLRQSIRKIVAQPDFVAWAQDNGYFLNPNGPAKLKETLEENGAIYRRLKPQLDKAKAKKS